MPLTSAVSISVPCNAGNDNEKNISRGPRRPCTTRARLMPASSVYFFPLFFSVSKSEDDSCVRVVRVRQVEAGQKEMKVHDEVLPSQT